MSRWRPRRGDETGFTLPELMVSMFLIAVIGAVVAGFVTMFSTTFTQERARLDSANVAAVGMNEMTRVVRAAVPIKNDYAVSGTGFDPAFVYAGAERVTLNAALDTTTALMRPIQVTFSLSSQRVLTETRVTPRAGGAGEAQWVFSGAGTTTSSKAIARTILSSTGSEPSLFRYYDTNDVQLVPPAGGSLSAADMARIATVEVYLKVQADPTSRADPVILINQVGLPNIGL